MSICMVEDCSNKLVAHGLCDKHRKRMERHGHLKQTRPSTWGEKEKHPLYNSWMWMKRMQHKYSICDEWKDFWKFVEDMGEKPSSSHRLNRADKHGNFSPENCSWKEVSANKDRAAYAKQWRKDNPDKVKNSELRKRFGITLEDYTNMYNEQDGKCKICNIQGNIVGFSLCVDHNHDTGKVRGLLCNTCNLGIGNLKDSVDNLKRAIEYLNS